MLMELLGPAAGWQMHQTGFFVAFESLHRGPHARRSTVRAFAVGVLGHFIERLRVMVMAHDLARFGAVRGLRYGWHGRCGKHQNKQSCADRRYGAMGQHRGGAMDHGMIPRG